VDITATRNDIAGHAIACNKRTKRLNGELHVSLQQVDGPALAMSGRSVNRVNVCVRRRTLCLHNYRSATARTTAGSRQAPIKTEYHRRPVTAVRSVSATRRTPANFVWPTDRPRLGSKN